MGNGSSEVEYASATGVYDFKNNESYEENFTKTGYISAHQKIVNKHKLNADNCRGYSVKDNGSLGFNSYTLNPGQYSDKYKDQIVQNRCMFTDQRNYIPNNGLC